MNGPLRKALRREWLVVRWPAWAWLGVRRTLLRVRWLALDLRDATIELGRGTVRASRRAILGVANGIASLAGGTARWFTEGWAPSWVRWRWAGLAPVPRATVALSREFARPFVAFGRSLAGGVDRRERAWVLPSLAGTTGLVLLVLLFVSQSGGMLRSDVDAREDGDPKTPAPGAVPERLAGLEPAPSAERTAPPPSPEREPALRDPFAAFDVVSEPPPAPEPEPEPELEFQPIPRRSPPRLATVEPGLDVEAPPPLDAEPFPPFEPIALEAGDSESPSEIELAPAARPDVAPPAEPFVPEPVELTLTLEPGPAVPAWQPGLEGTDFFTVSSPGPASVEGTSPLGPAAEPDGWELRPVRGAFTRVVPVVHEVREYAAATASSTLVRQERPRAEFAAFLEERSRIGETCAIEFQAANVGETTLDGLVVRIDLPEQFDHRFGRRIDYEIGPLEPGERRSARLIVACVAAGAGTVRLRLEGEAVDEVRDRDFEIAGPEREQPHIDATTAPEDEPRPRPSPSPRPVAPLAVPRWQVDPRCCQPF